MTFKQSCSVDLPEWVGPFVRRWEGHLDTETRRMELAIALSEENVRRGTGGPFGAIVVENESNRLIGAGVNLVTSLELSIAHAEVVAISLAQAAVDHWNLGDAADTQLVSSCEPCAMCYGAVPWSGVTSLIWGATREDAESAGFDEGDKPSDWEESLERRGIRTRAGVLRREAAKVLQDYASESGAIYHPNSQ